MRQDLIPHSLFLFVCLLLLLSCVCVTLDKAQFLRILFFDSLVKMQHVLQLSTCHDMENIPSPLPMQEWNVWDQLHQVTLVIIQASLTTAGQKACDCTGYMSQSFYSYIP